MRAVVLDLHSYAVGDALWRSFQKKGGFWTQASEAPGRTEELCRLFGAFAVVMEVIGNAPAYSLEARLRLREALRRSCPACRIVLIADERVEQEVAEKCREAVDCGEIDLFVSGSASVSQLITMLDRM